jgi:hypothetical protein
MNKFVLEVFVSPWETASSEPETKGTENITARSVLDGDITPSQAETL